MIGIVGKLNLERKYTQSSNNTEGEVQGTFERLERVEEPLKSARFRRRNSIEDLKRFLSEKGKQSKNFLKVNCNH